MGPGPRGNVGCFEGGRSAPTAQLCAGEVSTEICTFVGRIDCQAVLSPNAEEQNNCFGWAMLCSFHGLPDDFEERSSPHQDAVPTRRGMSMAGCFKKFRPITFTLTSRSSTSSST